MINFTQLDDALHTFEQANRCKINTPAQTVYQKAICELLIVAIEELQIINKKLK